MPRTSPNSARGRSRRKDAPRSIRYAVVGLGHIAQAAVLPAFQHASVAKGGRNSRLVALVSDDREKLNRLGRRYRVDLTANYDRYLDVVTSGEIDAVYIALPNHLHAEYAIAAARAGVHVLCEKPMAVTVEECEQMIAARDRFGVKMMVAYRLHFEKANLKAVEIAQSGKLGTLRLFESTFSFNVKPDNIRTDSSKGGGPLYDIGVYCINAARYLFRQDPIEVAAFSATRRGDKRFADIDEALAVLLRFPDERLATFVVSFGAAATATYRIVGDKGDLCVDNAYEYTEPITHDLTIGGRTRSHEFPKRDQFAPELIYFSNCILKNRDPEPSAEEGLKDVRIVEAIQRSAANRGEVVEVGALPDDPHPSMRQEIRRPAVPREPELVHAESASRE